MKKSTRQLCSNCHYPLPTCVCETLTILDCPVRITILQDSSEVGHAKNTVRLLQLAIPTTKVIVVNDSTMLPDALFQDSVVIYPNETALPVEQWSQPNPLKVQESYNPVSTIPALPKQLILLDGSWRKTHKIWMQHPILQTIPAVTFAQANATEYRIRKANKPNSMSTLEACAYTLEQLFAMDCRPLKELQATMQRHWDRFASQ